MLGSQDEGREEGKEMVGRLAEEEQGAEPPGTQAGGGRGRRNWLDTPLIAPPPDPLPHRSSSPVRSHLLYLAEKSPLQAREFPHCEGPLKLGHKPLWEILNILGETYAARRR